MEKALSQGKRCMKVLSISCLLPRTFFTTMKEWKRWPLPLTGSLVTRYPVIPLSALMN